MSLTSRIRKLEEQAKRANAGYYLIAPKYQTTDINNPKYGLLEASNGVRPFTHIYYSDETLTENTVRELLGLNEHDQIIIIERSFVDNCMGSE